MYTSGMFNDISPNAVMNGMRTSNLFFGGLCAIYLALESRFAIPNPTIPIPFSYYSQNIRKGQDNRYE
jgi:hypothetical protein